MSHFLGSYVVSRMISSMLLGLLHRSQAYGRRPTSNVDAAIRSMAAGIWAEVGAEHGLELAAGPGLMLRGSVVGIECEIALVGKGTATSTLGRGTHDRNLGGRLIVTPANSGRAVAACLTGSRMRTRDRKFDDAFVLIAAPPTFADTCLNTEMRGALLAMRSRKPHLAVDGDAVTLEVDGTEMAHEHLHAIVFLLTFAWSSFSATAKPPATSEELLGRHVAGERDFRGADLHGADLHGADLHGANLSDANLSNANLHAAHLSDANLSNANVAGAHASDANLSDTNFAGANLSYTDLAGANLFGANLRGANLSGANLRGATLVDTDLTGTALVNANLSSTKIEGAKLVDADLTGVNLAGANLVDTDLTGANLTGASLAATVLIGVDLSSFCQTRSTIRHYRPSTIDHTSTLLSVHAPCLKEFLAQAGMPEVLVEYMVDSAISLRSDVFNLLRSTFISYGSPDEAFARKLYESLHRNGVTTFFFPEHALPGEKLHRTVRKKVNDLDRTVLICSSDSLDRKGVMNEIEQALDREARDAGASYLIPITIDDYVFTGWKPPNPDIAQAIRDKVVADFRGAAVDPAKFQTALQRLLAALKK
jgi:uncharacterized protein YjbI with pentapeptide repeats